MGKSAIGVCCVGKMMLPQHPGAVMNRFRRYAVIAAAIVLIALIFIMTYWAAISSDSSAAKEDMVRVRPKPVSIPTPEELERLATRRANDPWELLSDPPATRPIEKGERKFEVVRYLPDNPKWSAKVREKLADLKLTPADAYKIAARQAIEDKAHGYTSVDTVGDLPVAIVDSSYVFTTPLALLDAATLEGYYVDGNTGTIEWRPNVSDVLLWSPNDPEIGPRLRQRVSTFRINDAEAREIITKAWEKSHQDRTFPLRHPKLHAITGRNYCFESGYTYAQNYSILGNYFVNGDTGAISYGQ
jgi:hypothetical protein